MRAKSLNALEIMANLEAGLFYASTGVELESLNILPTRLEIIIRPRSDFRYTTEFLGPQGKLLSRSQGTTAVYDLKSTVTYVRGAGEGLWWGACLGSAGVFETITPLQKRRFATSVELGQIESSGMNVPLVHVLL